MTKKKDKLNWEYNSEQFIVGKCVLEPIADNAISKVLNVVGFDINYLIVFFEGNLFTYHTAGFKNSCCFQDIYQKRKPYWVNPKRVFQVLKVQ